MNINFINLICSHEFEGRKPGTRGMRKAKAFVEEDLKSVGVQPFFNDSYYDTLMCMEPNRIISWE